MRYHDMIYIILKNLQYQAYTVLNLMKIMLEKKLLQTKISLQLLKTINNECPILS
jgi:hypothetical protein